MLAGNLMGIKIHGDMELLGVMECLCWLIAPYGNQSTVQFLPAFLFFIAAIILHVAVPIIYFLEPMRTMSEIGIQKEEVEADLLLEKITLTQN